MTRWILAGLIFLNLVLGIGLYLRLGERSAQAAIGGGGADFASVSGYSANGQAIVYILQPATGHLLAIRTDPINHKVELAGGKNITPDLQRMRKRSLFEEPKALFDFHGSKPAPKRARNNKMKMTLKKNAGIWMVVLTMTAIVMGVLLLSTSQRPAEAVMLNAQSDYSLMTTGTPGGDEVLIIVDKTTQKMVIYKMNGNSLDLMAGADFGKLFAAAGGGR